MSLSHSKRVRVRVPASTANLGPGFDTLGMALNLYAWIEMSVSAHTSIHLYGDHMEGVATDSSNLIYQVAQKVFERVGVLYPDLEISVYSDIPLARGLGSSASAIVGALVAANALVDEQNQLSLDELFQIATEMEEHPDNVGASIFGGLVVAYWDGERAEHVRIEPDVRIGVIAAIPHFQLSTSKARHILPQQVSMQDAVFNVSHASLLVAALFSGKLELIANAMKDALHQPYRATLIPGMKRILEEATAYGAFGIALSGAGPTIIALVDAAQSDHAALTSFLRGTLSGEGIQSDLLTLSPASAGAQICDTFDEKSSFIQNVERERKLL